MAGTRRHGVNAAIWMDISSGGAATVGTTIGGTNTLTLITSKASWSYDQSRDFVDVTSFGDTSKTAVAGLSGSSGTISGYWDMAGGSIFMALTDTKERGIIIQPDARNDPTKFISGYAFFSGKVGGGVLKAVAVLEGRALVPTAREYGEALGRQCKRSFEDGAHNSAPCASA